MSIGTGLAIYFIIWWLVLFAVLPFGLKTQDEDSDVTLGTVPSAPRGGHMKRALLLTTIVAGVVFAIYALATRYFGLGFHSLPNFFAT